MTSSIDPYDAVLLLSFGGPEAPEDVLPFLRRVTHGRGIPDERLAAVAEHYHARGGRSPINDQNRLLRSAIDQELRDRGVGVPVYWGNRNWHPLLADTLREMRADGIRRAAVFLTSAYPSYSGCRQYREDLAAAVAEVESDGSGPAPLLDRLRHYGDHPGFVRANADAVVAAARELGLPGTGPAPDRASEGVPAPGAWSGPDAPRLVFVTHSIPVAMAEASGPRGNEYLTRHRATAATIAAAVVAGTGAPAPEWDLVFCSRSGAPGTPWTEPDVNDHLAELAARGVTSVVLAPIGFVSDHMEVVHDLDVEAADTARSLGLRFARAATAGTHPEFVATIVDLCLERAAAERARASERDEWPDRPSIDPAGALPDLCAAGCCANPRGPRPALGGAG